MKGKVAVVIPVYKSSIDKYEEVALKRCFRILNAHPVFFVKPVGLHLTEYLPFLEGKSFFEKSFDSDFFFDIRGYNRLMLSPVFYKEFLDYEYILIYQLDAIVFKDELLYWCNKGYDYIGAPWLDPYSLKETIQSFFHYRLNKKQQDNGAPTKIQVYNRVGNGGFSLRRVSKFYKICLKEKRKIDYYNQRSDNHFFNEDVFWSLEINRRKRVLKIPGYKIAARFALEQKPEIGLEISKGELPFGAHAWPTTFEIWVPFIKELSENP